MARPTYQQQLAAVLADPSVKFAHKSMARTLDAMDPVDALSIVDALQELALVRHEEVMRAARIDAVLNETE